MPYDNERWRAVQGADDWLVRDADDWVVVVTTCKTDADRIAAVPDMEKALEAWLEWDGEIREELSPPMLARAALAKARGETDA